ncbi:hypothetical protein C8Q79DRAFT_315196 [Trametes meyenii]|nr:hypothetical protein C8Q79DRAFT_315196 [Trametes meyenii]
MDQGPTHSTATLLFSFLLSFLGVSLVTVLGGLLWQKILVWWRGDVGNAMPVGSQPALKPRIWDVCIRDVLSTAKHSDCAWEQLCPLALRVTSAPVDGTTSDTSRPKKWKLRPFRRHRPAFQAHTDESNCLEDGITLQGCHSSIAVVIAYPSRPIKAEEKEVALGIAHALCHSPHGGQDGALGFR